MYIFTDGSSIESSTKASSSVIFWFKGKEPIALAKVLPKGGTNSRAELMAIDMALNIIERCHDILSQEEIVIYTDNLYALNAHTIWGKKWKSEGWQDREHIELIKRNYYRVKKLGNITFKHVKAHNDKRCLEWPFIGNFVADWAAKTVLHIDPKQPVKFKNYIAKRDIKVKVIKISEI